MCSYTFLLLIQVSLYPFYRMEIKTEQYNLNGAKQGQDKALVILFVLLQMLLEINPSILFALFHTITQKIFALRLLLITNLRSFLDSHFTISTLSS